MVDKRGLLSADAVEDGAGYASFPPSSGTAPPLASPSSTHGSGGKRGCRDPLFLAAFILNLGIIVWLAADYGAAALKEAPKPDAENPAIKAHDGHPLIVLCSALAAIAGVLAGGWMTFMIKKAADIIKFTLWTSIILSLFSAVLGLVSGQAALVVFGLLSSAISFCYMRAVKRFIPFAAANLRAATAAVNDFFPVMYAAYLLLVLAFLWSVLWSVGVYGVINYYQKKEDAVEGGGDEGDEGGVAGVWYFLLLVSFFWTLQVVGGVLNCTVAGVVGSWWFIPKPDQTNVVSGSFSRASTTSLGSICFGALIVAVLEAMKTLIEKARENRDNALKCLVDCLISCLDAAAQYLNRWAFTYIGIYGHSFMEAGHKVYNLFTRRGLTTLLNDNLIGRVLFLGSFMVGLLTCGIGVLLAFALQHSYLKDVEDAPSLLGGAGFVVGFFVTDVMMNVVSAAVAAVLVCFLEDSQALAITHPDYHSYLLAAWSMRFPDINW